MTDWNAVTAFMANVVAWPGVNEPGYVNLHYSMVNQKVPNSPLLKGLGWPLRDVTTFVNKAAWVATTANLKDVWFCTSLQSQSGKNSRGNPKAVRGAMNATKQKSIWIDMDVGIDKPDKKYATVEEALTSAITFHRQVGLPVPSAIVFSGTGIQVYWISKTALTPAEWAPYASGLKGLLLMHSVKCDAGLTTDIARILRVPGTLNHKYDPPKPVQLSPLPLVMYNFEEALSFLPQFATQVSVVGTASKAEHTLFADGVDAQSFGKPAFTIAGATPLGAGIEPRADVLLKADPIFRQCGFMKHALKTEGADYDNPLWNLSVLCSTFMENGNAIAHAISKGHASYSEADTQALYDRKVADRHDRGIGYPSCATIQGSGCTACATCPLFPKGKSPLNIRPAFTATVNPISTSGQTPKARALDLPSSYDVNDDGIICKVIELTSKEGELLPPIMVPLFYCVISDPWVQKIPDCINFTVTVDKGFTHQAAILHSKMSGMGFASYLAEDQNRVKINTDGKKYLEEFFLAWLAKLHAAAAAQQAQPFGWYRDGANIKGFVFGGNVMEDDGSVRPCGIGDPNIKRYYTPQGDIADWYAASKTVTGRQRPELTCVMLMSFASPLVALLGKNSTMLSVWGETGAGKSAAYSVGMAVWGDPKKTKGSEQSTRNAVTTQMREIKNLPFYWDEITNDDARKRVYGVMHEASDGVEKARNLSGTATQARGDWELMLIAASNGSYREYLAGVVSNHAAALVRVLEWEAKRVDNGPGQLSNADAEAIISKLKHSYGMMGLKYAQYLAVNHAAIETELVALQNRYEIELGASGDERFWTTALACMVCAAKYAQQLGVEVDPQDIEEFLFRVYADNRGYRDRIGMTAGRVNNTEVMLTRYLKERHAEERVIWTNYIHDKQGRPTKPVTILMGPTQKRNNIGGIEVRFAIENSKLILCKLALDPWLKENKYSQMQTEDQLRADYHAEFDRLNVNSGTVHATGREPAIIIPVVKDTTLYDMMMLYADDAMRAAAEKGTTPEPVDTGLMPVENVVAFVKGATRG